MRKLLVKKYVLAAILFLMISVTMLLTFFYLNYGIPAELYNAEIHLTYQADENLLMVDGQLRDGRAVKGAEVSFESGISSICVLETPVSPIHYSRDISAAIPLNDTDIVVWQGPGGPSLLLDLSTLFVQISRWKNGQEAGRGVLYNSSAEHMRQLLRPADEAKQSAQESGPPNAEDYYMIVLPVYEWNSEEIGRNPSNTLQREMNTYFIFWNDGKLYAKRHYGNLIVLPEKCSQELTDLFFENNVRDGGPLK